MTIIEVRARPNELSPRQRWSHYFALLYGLVAVVIGINLRDATLNATVPYTNIQAGIRAYYPQNWLIDSDGDYVMRVRDMSQPGFKTTMQVAVQPISLATTSRNLIDILTLNRSQTLSGYDIVRVEPYLLDEIQATAMTYTFVASDANAFLESLPVVVEGLDILIDQGGQALIVTYLADVNQYEQTLPVFERFLVDLEF
jgi:hypothetical protein